MAGITEAQAQARLDALLAAHDAIVTGQSYTIEDRTLTRSNLKEVQAAIEYWDNKVKQLSGSGAARVSYGVPTA